MKEFHIINVGTTIITNFQRSNLSSQEVKTARLSDNVFWKNFLDNPKLMNELYEFVKSNPKKNSAELNSFLRMIENYKSSQIEVYFTGTKTPVNEICIRILEKYMIENGFTVYTSKEVPGYFLTTYFEEDKVRSFVQGISEMLDHLIKLASKKKEEGYEVYFNPTGGFKAHVIANALAGFMSFCNVYYIHEEFDDLIVFPPLFYLPKGKEIELLEILQDKIPKSGKEYEKLADNFAEEMERLEHYGLIEREKDEFGKLYRVKITNKGLLYLKLRKEEV
ncbi:MAG: hypothetical protein PWQ78_192 [Petrotoga sp.]|uniref:Putative CRISPR-associated protein n=1 Tax=Thermodesulfobacterium commune TaxID=1741 RepID=A0A3B8N2U4_9BACT|nr:putative CRISPR-associated protein [Thermodesulfobacterium thermophilum]MDK2811982.1 hypothetical protein [Petrotoga sp.]HAA83489.1 putative CRISPR-associated protein [Thermodesulfobacterium commune]HCP10096.1 putative CRISPR-associated protein [Thermodesulfobacterium commune]